MLYILQGDILREYLSVELSIGNVSLDNIVGFGDVIKGSRVGGLVWCYRMTFLRKILGLRGRN